MPRLSSHALHGGPPLVLALALACTAMPALAAEKAEPRLPVPSNGQRYALVGSLTASSEPASAQGSGFELKSTMKAAGSHLPLQENDRFALIAKLALSPTVCYGDTIFRDGFEP